MLEYKVVMDQSMKGDNNADAIAKKVNEMVEAGWRLAHVTSFATTNVSRVYCFFEREKAG